MLNTEHKQQLIVLNKSTTQKLNMIKASIITIGDELLIGQVVDTNSAWMAQQLNLAGIPVVRRVAVGDNWDEIWKALDEESDNADIILITGGLGPTADDITKPLLCKYFDGKMITDNDALNNLKHLFENIYKRPITERNIKQAEVPDTCKVIVNKRGTAPCMWFEKASKIYVSMPGVPYEMKGLMEENVIPELIKKFSLPHIAHKTLITFGIGESNLADLLIQFETDLPKHIKLAYLPNYGIVRLRLSSIGNEKEKVEKEINFHFEKLKSVTKEYMINDTDESMEVIVSKLLKEKNKTLSTAESCTGGYIAHLLTSHAGSSSFFKGSVVSYSNESKENMLGVNSNTIENYGAVSEETVTEMVKGVLQKMNTDFAIAVSGIMGPDGGTAEKPVGTVWVAAGNKEEITTKKFNFRFDRQKNIQLTAMNAMNFLRAFVLCH